MWCCDNTDTPTAEPSASPTRSPSASPSISPSDSPSRSPSVSPSDSPSRSPSVSPSASPTPAPSASPSQSPSWSPSGSPSASPSLSPTLSPSADYCNNGVLDPEYETDVDCGGQCRVHNKCTYLESCQEDEDCEGTRACHASFFRCDTHAPTSSPSAPTPGPTVSPTAEPTTPRECVGNLRCAAPPYSFRHEDGLCWSVDVLQSTFFLRSAFSGVVVVRVLIVARWGFLSDFLTARRTTASPSTSAATTRWRHR